MTDTARAVGAAQPPALARTHGHPAPPVRLLHLGLGNFMRAHLAWYTAHATDAASWGIAAFTGRSPRPPEGLATQDGLYTLVVRGPAGDGAEVIESLSAVHGRAEHETWLRYWRDPQLRIVTLTVTEAGYRFDGDHGRDAADVAALRAEPGAPVVSPVARLVAGILARRAAAAGAITLLPCDNLPDNGAVLAAAILACSERIDPTLSRWIRHNVTVASSMVDRITPATTPDMVTDVEALTGTRDLAPVVTEPFTEWVIAGDFPAGRPAWAATFVADVRPYEQRKLWLLNGTHSLLAYTGLARGHATVAQAINDPTCRHWVQRWRDEAGRHLDFKADQVAHYCASVTERFRNPRIHHRLEQIAADGSEKIRARILPVLLAERAAGRIPVAACHAVGAWVAHLRTAAGTVIDAHANQLSALVHDDLDDTVRRVLAWLDPSLADDEAAHRAVLSGAGRSTAAGNEMTCISPERTDA